MSRLISEMTDNLQNVRSGEKYGIEVEAEGCPYDLAGGLDWSDAFRRHWSTTSDGSLRNGGIEFISKPLAKAYVPPAVDSLWRYMDEGRMHPSVRTGIHIHCNMVGRTIADTMRVLTHYAYLEPQLFDFVGKEREENIYCIPWYRAHDEPRSVRAFLMQREVPEFREYATIRDRSPCKYSAMFVGPITRLGTIEFRHAPTFTDRAHMMHWWQLVQAVWRTAATEYDVASEFDRLGPVGFAKQVFKNVPGVNYVGEEVYERADVEAVAALLLPPKPVLANEWGMAPELRGPGVATPGVTVPPRPARGTDRITIGRTPPRMTLDPRADIDHIRRYLDDQPIPVPETLTVNVAPVEQAMMDEWLDENDYDEESDDLDYEPEHEEEEF